MTEQLLTRQQLGKRWGAGIRSIDRLRERNELPWIDISPHRRDRPMIRFRLSDIEQFERMRTIERPSGEAV